jgi:hypothetical protein
VQIAALCLKSGNAVLLKGGAEAERSNRALAAALSEALAGCGFPSAALTLLASRADVAELLTAREDVDLIVPRGSNALVAAIQQATTIPVLGHAEGICHVVVDAAADLETALAVVVDSKVQYPSACNAVETVLVHTAVAARFVPMLCVVLGERGVEVRGDETARALGGPAGPGGESRGLGQRVRRSRRRRARGGGPRRGAAAHSRPRFAPHRSDRHRGRRGLAALRCGGRRRGASTATSRRASPTARATASAPRSGSRPASSTRAARSGSTAW